MTAQTAQTVSAPTTYPSGTIVALNMPIDDYLATYASTFHEWVKGMVIKMAPVTLRHAELVDYLKQLFLAYFALNPIGRVLGEPFVMRLDAVESVREPDLQIILHANPGELTETAMIGPADVCIEVVSEESSARDYGDKFEEYERAGVREYWTVDPLRQECRFFRLGASGRYATILPDAAGDYRTPALPGFAVHVPTLWQEALPDFFAIGQAVRAMLEAGT